MAFNLSASASAGSPAPAWFNISWQNLPPGCAGPTYNNSSKGASVVNCTATTVGTYGVDVVVTDSAGGTKTSGLLNITVNQNLNLTAFSPSTLNLTLGNEIWFNATATGGTPALTYLYGGLPPGCSNSTASFHCIPTRVGLYSVTATAIDSIGFRSVTLSHILNVSNTSQVVTPTKRTSSGLTATGWAIVAGIFIVGAIIVIAMLLLARREERSSQLVMTSTPTAEPPTGSGGAPPPEGPQPPSGPSM
jgi:hypothetical protein